MPINENKYELMVTVMQKMNELKKALICLQRGDNGELPETTDDAIINLRSHLSNVYSQLEALKINYNVEKRIH